MKKIVYLLAIVLIVAACGQKQQTATTDTKTKKKAKNIILMIGDGMGISQVYAAYKVKNDNTAMARCKIIGLVNTSSADELITDSAAAGTAIATGKKTNNGHIGVLPSGEKLKTILEIAEKHGKASGLIATSAITHATPASFIAHHPSRHEYEALAMDFLQTEVDVFFGGGKAHFGAREDGLNLLDSLQNKGYNLIYNYEEIDDARGSLIAGLFGEKHLPKHLEGRGDYLDKASMKAIEVLDQNENGFFLMIESSQIDWGGHDNDQEYVVDETAEFDNLVGKVLDFAEKNGETLVIVTSDHETGGFTIVDGKLKGDSLVGHFSTEHHTPVFVPLFAYGPGAEEFGGLYENTAIFDKMVQAFGFGE